jgi:site-specific DNA recombinase
MWVNTMQAQNSQGYTPVKYNDNLPWCYHFRCGSCGTPLTANLVRQKGIHYYKYNAIGCKLNRNAGKMYWLYQDLLKQYQIEAKKLLQVQVMMGQVLKGLSQDHEQEGKRLKSAHRVGKEKGHAG